MVRTIRAAVILLMVAGMAVVTLPGYCQEAKEAAITSVSAEVVSVDLAKSTMVVKKLKDAIADTYENLTILVSPEVKILKDEAALKLSDIKIGDKVTIKSVNDLSGKTKVESISVAGRVK